MKFKKVECDYCGELLEPYEVSGRGIVEYENVPNWKLKIPPCKNCIRKSQTKLWIIICILSVGIIIPYL